MINTIVAVFPSILIQGNTYDMSKTDLSNLGLSADGVGGIDARLIYLDSILGINTNNIDIIIIGNEDRTSVSDGAVLSLSLKGYQIIGN